jgi:hypothetical protein
MSQGWISTSEKTIGPASDGVQGTGGELRTIQPLTAATRRPKTNKNPSFSTFFSIYYPITYNYVGNIFVYFTLPELLDIC